MRLYKINLDYIRYLHNIDNRVQYNAGQGDTYNENRPYIGVVFNINGNPFFAPLEHPRPSHKTIKDRPHIFKIANGKYGIIGLNNMIPVPPSQLIAFDINTAPNRKILLSQFVFCRKNKNRILAQASKVYQQRLTPNDFVEKVYCDFQALEQAAQAYQPSLQQNSPTPSLQTPTAASRPSIKAVLENALAKTVPPDEHNSPPKSHTE